MNIKKSIQFTIKLLAEDVQTLSEDPRATAWDQTYLCGELAGARTIIVGVDGFEKELDELDTLLKKSRLIETRD